MINSLLVNEGCMLSRLERVAQRVQTKLLNIQSRNVESSSFNDWFEEIKSEAEGGKFERRGSVAVINIMGGLDYRYDFWSWLFDCSCYMGISNAVQQAVADPSITKIVLYVDSPGGGFHGCQECADVIYAANESKEVVAVVDPEAASAGYWLASQASRIVCLESGWVGSLGSQTSLVSYHRMYQEVGIDKELIRAAISPNKNLGYSSEPISEAARDERKRWADYAGELFVSHVMRGRGKTRQQVLDNFGQGTMYFAADAVGRGMIDAIGSLHSEVAQVPVSQVQSQATPKRVRSEQLHASELL